VRLTCIRHLLDINAGFDRVLCGLEALRDEAAFNQDELERLFCPGEGNPRCQFLSG
jgi:hypothetical protein